MAATDSKKQIGEIVSWLQDKLKETNELIGSEITEYDFCELEGMKKAYEEVIKYLKE